MLSIDNGAVPAYWPVLVQKSEFCTIFNSLAKFSDNF